DIQLQQAFTNLIGNATKYTPNHGRISIRAWVEEEIADEKYQFFFEVEDTGYGVPASKKAHVFNPFFRAVSPSTEHISGTGLGLSLVKTVITKHGGVVYMESEEGVGSVFGCRLPLV